MKFEFVVNNYNPEFKKHNMIIQQAETTQEFIDKNAPESSYKTMINLENDDIKIITANIDKSTGVNWISQYFKISEINRISFKMQFNGILILLIFLALFIFGIIFVAMYFFNIYKSIYLIGFIGILIYSFLDDIVEIMVIDKSEKEQIEFPIKKIMDFYDDDFLLNRFLEELIKQNPTIKLEIAGNVKFNKRKKIYKIIFIVFWIIFVLGLLLSFFI